MANNHPHRAILPFKVYPGTSALVAAFRHEDDAIEFARQQSRGNSITYTVKTATGVIDSFFRGESFKEVEQLAGEEAAKVDAIKDKQATDDFRSWQDGRKFEEKNRG